LTCGLSTTATTVRSLTSTSSTFPASTWKTSTALQRSLSAPASNETVHGQGMSHEQFSK
jgi:hypothetical protein